MATFDNVTVIKQANVYFDGKVTSRTILFPDGAKKTLGIMLPGEYTFNTGDREIMEIMTGELDVLLPGSTHGKPWPREKNLKCRRGHRFLCRSEQ